MRVEYSRAAEKYLRKLLKSAPASAKIIADKITRLAAETHTPSKARAVRGKKADYMRLVAGDFRVIYQTRDDCLFIAAIGLRNDSAVYRELMRRGE